jgi:hypothetical protein
MRNAAKMFFFDPNPTTARKSLVLFYLFTLWCPLSIIHLLAIAVSVNRCVCTQLNFHLPAVVDM